MFCPSVSLGIRDHIPLAKLMDPKEYMIPKGAVEIMEEWCALGLAKVYGVQAFWLSHAGGCSLGIQPDEEASHGWR